MAQVIRYHPNFIFDMRNRRTEVLSNDIRKDIVKDRVEISKLRRGGKEIKNNFFFRVPGKVDIKELEEKIMGLLNKLSQNNYEKISNDLMYIITNGDNEEVTKFTIKCVFDNAASAGAANWRDLYVKIFAQIITKDLKQFWDAIVSEKLASMEELLEGVRTQHDGEQSILIANKNQYTAIYDFISMLHNRKLVTQKVLCQYITVLFANINQTVEPVDNVHFVSALKTIFNTVRNRNIYKKFAVRIEKLRISDGKIKMKSEFDLEDIQKMFKKQ